MDLLSVLACASGDAERNEKCWSALMKLVCRVARRTLCKAAVWVCTVYVTQSQSDGGQRPAREKACVTAASWLEHGVKSVAGTSASQWRERAQEHSASAVYHDDSEELANMRDGTAIPDCY